MSDAPWQASLTVPPSLVTRLISEQFPELCPVTVRYLSAGWDNTVYSINEKWLFRFPHRPLALPLLQTELAVLPDLASHLPLSIPVPQWVGQPSTDYPWTFAGYLALPGQTACRLRLPADSRHRWTGIIGQCLRQLHQLSQQWAHNHHVPLDQHQRMNIPQRTAMIESQLTYLHQAGLISSMEPWLPLYQSVPLEPDTLNLVHGDLYARHFIATAQGQLTGIIDWGDIHWGGPAQDLRIAFSFLPPEAFDDFLQAYGPISAITQARARFSALYSTTAILQYGLHIHDQDLLWEGQQSLKWLAQIAASLAH